MEANYFVCILKRLSGTVILMPFSEVQSAPARNVTHSVARPLRVREAKSGAAGGKRKTQSQKFKVQRGVTLIELLVVMAIIGILATIMLANYSNFGARQEVRNAAAELKSNLRKYQTFALASQKNPDQSGTCTAKSLDSYSIRIEPGGSPPYNVDVNCPPSQIDLSDNYPWSGNFTVVVGHFDPVTSTHTSCGSIKIVFKPLNYGLDLECPDGTPVPSGESAYITLSNSAATYRVYVTSSGEIYDTH